MNFKVILCSVFGSLYWRLPKMSELTTLSEEDKILSTVLTKRDPNLSKYLISSYFIPCLQMVFIISICNNQLLDWIENELIWVLGFLPGFDTFLPTLTAKLHAAKDKYLSTSQPLPSNIKVLHSLKQSIYLSLSYDSSNLTNFVPSLCKK